MDAFGGYIAMSMKVLVMLLVYCWLSFINQGAYLYNNIDLAVSVLVLAWCLTVVQDVITRLQLRHSWWSTRYHVGDTGASAGWTWDSSGIPYLQTEEKTTLCDHSTPSVRNVNMLVDLSYMCLFSGLGSV